MNYDLIFPFFLLKTRNLIVAVFIGNNFQQSHSKSYVTPSVYSSDTVTPIFDHAHPRSFQSPFNLHKCATAYKKSVTSICSFLRYGHFWGPETRLDTPIFDHAQPNNFKSTFVFCEFVPTCTHQAVSSIYSGKTIDVNILPSDWLRAFWPISQEQGFS